MASRRQARGAAALGWVLALTACGGGGNSARELSQEAMSVKQQVSDPAAIRRQFEEAAACGDRYHCPAQDDLLARAEGAEGTSVAEVAMELMTDPTVRSFDRLGTAAYEVVRAWAAARVKSGSFDQGARDRFLDGVRQILASDSSTFIEPVYVLFDGPIGDALPESRQLLTAEVTNPRRDLAQMDAAAHSLQRFLPDLSQIRSWLASGDERRELAGLSLLDYMDHRRVPVDQELPMLQALSRRPDLSVDVAIAVIGHVEGNHEGDEAFRPVLAPLLRHPDSEVRERAKAATGHAGT